MDYIELFAQFYDEIVIFVKSFTLYELVSLFWFLFIFEIPRYYIIDFLVIIYYAVTSRARREKHERARRKLFSENPLVSILVPGKNEGAHIFKLAESIRMQTYKNYELIVVDDGSDDNTALIGYSLESNGYIDKFLHLKERGGKASAANYGLEYSKGKYIVHLDADSSLDENALEEILIPFYLSPKIKGIGGCVKVRNADASICSSMQAIEYLESIMMGRTVTSQLKIYRIISGAFGAFDAAVLRGVGAWDIGPGLDGDITQKIRKAGWDVHFANQAVCLTNVPTSFFLLAKQRMRWSKSLVRFRIRKHVDILLPTKNFSFLNFISNFENIFFNFFLDILWVFYLINLVVNNAGYLLELFVLKVIIMFVLGNVSFFAAMLISERWREELRFYKYLPMMTFYTGMFLRIVRVLAYIREIFFFSSYKDPWNPRKTSISAQLDGG